MKNKNTQKVSKDIKTNAPAAENAVAESTMSPSEDLQVFYNDAYFREKQRLNSIFGIIEEDAPVQKETIYIQPSPEEYVALAVHKKLKRKAGILALLSVASIAVAIVFALIAFKVF